MLSARFLPVLIVVAASAGRAQLPPSYRFQSICPSACQGISLSNGGYVAAYSLEPYLPVVYSPGFGTVPVSGAASITQVNSSGAVVGATLRGEAFAAMPPYNLIENLDSVFGWNNGNALGINDRGDIIGVREPSADQTLLPGLFEGYPYQINNAGQLTASYIDGADFLQFILRSPDGATTLVLGGPPVALSNTGHVLIYDTTQQYIQSADGKKVMLPAGVTWLGLNDLDQVVGIDKGMASMNRARFYSAATGVVDLAPLLGRPEYYLVSATAINNRGEILAVGQRTDLSQPFSFLMEPAGAPL